MKNTLIFIICLLASCTSPKEELKITYLANCGFLFENQSDKILIDPFGTKYGDLFYLPTSNIHTNIETGSIPFDDINLVLITHIHGDHFNPFLAEKFLQNNKNAKMICPPQVFNQIKDSCENWKQIESQIISPQISRFNLEKMNVNGIPIKILRMQHGTDRSLEGITYENYTDYEKTENFGYVMELNNKVVFHQGDASLKINEKILNKLQQKVDIAHLGFFDWDTISYNLLKEKLQTKNIIFMHGTKIGEELEKKDFKSIVTNLIFFKRELESKYFE